MASEAVEYTVSYLLSFEVEGQAREVHVDELGVARPAEAVRQLGLACVRGRQTRRVRIRPTVELAMVGCEACVHVDLRAADALYLNGYNSWTDSCERAPRAAMRGLLGVPGGVVDRWGLDCSGDYRFTPQDARPGHQHGFGYGYLRLGERVLLVGSLREDDGFTTIYEDLWRGQLRLEKEVPRRTVAAGEECELVAFALCEGTLDEAVERWLGLSGVAPRPARPLVGFSSWYRYYQDISEDRLMSDLVAVGELLADHDLGACTPVFQIDDGYAQIGDWTAPHADLFGHGMAWFADQIARRGLMPGLWMAPFVCETDSALYREHQDWLLRDEEGAIVFAGSNWSGYYPLDTRNPEVREHVRTALGMATYEWGFKLLKLDFLFAACMVPHDGLNRGQLMADALGLLRSSVPGDVAFDLCGVPLMSALGRTEYCRIGPDVSLDWDGEPYERMLHRERVSTKRSLANTIGRAHLDGRAFRNDPDVFFLREDVKLTGAQRHELLNADAALGGMFLTSDDVSAWNDEQRFAFDLALAVFVERALEA